MISRQLSECGNLQTTMQNTSVQIYQITIWIIPTSIHWQCNEMRLWACLYRKGPISNDNITRYCTISIISLIFHSNVLFLEVSIHTHCLKSQNHSIFLAATCVIEVIRGAGKSRRKSSVESSPVGSAPNNNTLSGPAWGTPSMPKLNLEGGATDPAGMMNPSEAPSPGEHRTLQ